MNLSDFVAGITRYQPLDASRWSVYFGRPDADNYRLNLMVRNVELPGKTLGGNDFVAYGPGRHIAARQLYEDELSMSFLVGKDGYESDYFAAWQDQVVDPKTNNPNYYVNYVADLGIQQFDKAGKLRYAWKFYEVYPYTIDATTLTNDPAADEGLFLTTKVTFKYKSFNWSGVDPNLFADRIQITNDFARGDLA